MVTHIGDNERITLVHTGLSTGPAKPGSDTNFVMTQNPKQSFSSKKYG